MLWFEHSRGRFSNNPPLYSLYPLFSLTGIYTNLSMHLSYFQPYNVCSGYSPSLEFSFLLQSHGSLYLFVIFSSITFFTSYSDCFIKIIPLFLTGIPVLRKCTVDGPTYHKHTENECIEMLMSVPATQDLALGWVQYDSYLQISSLVVIDVQLLSCVWLLQIMNCSPPGSSVHVISQASV